jgi:hypothetical protein
MRKQISQFFVLSFLLTACASFFACQGGGGGGAVTGNENGSAPVNNEEMKEYKKAIMRCYKTGGSRVVKIEGKLNCY